MLLLLVVFLVISVYAENVTVPDRILTSSSGAQIYRNQISTMNQNLLFNEYFMDSISHAIAATSRPRISHAKGTGALGYFEVTYNITQICKASLFNHIGKQTPVVARFSTTVGDVGSPDTVEENRGMAVKLYTEDGILDLLTMATETFYIKDPIKFVAFIHAGGRNPRTNILDKNYRWDFRIHHPESFATFLRLYANTGLLDGYRSMHGYVIHPYQVVNDKGDTSFVKFSFKPVGKDRFLTKEEAEEIQGKDFDYACRDLHENIAKGNYPIWKLLIQVLTAEEVRNANFDVFDITKTWPVSIPTIEVGKLVLNKSPRNFYAEIEQVAMSPSNLVPGILGGVDSVFQARLFAYRYAAKHRLGGNYNKIPVNCPFVQNTCNRNGEPPVNDNGLDTPSYYPNSWNVPEVGQLSKPVLWNPYIDPTPNNFEQAGEFYLNLPDEEKARTVKNIAKSLMQVKKYFQIKGLELLKVIHPELSARVKKRMDELA